MINFPTIPLIPSKETKNQSQNLKQQGPMRRTLSLLFSLLLLFQTGCFHKNAQLPPLAVADHIDLKRYAGLWHEIARYPHRFENGCKKVTAEYSLNNDGSIAVLNKCLKEGGQKSSATGQAKIVNGSNNAKLKVSFFWPFYGNYWILKIGPDYQYAIVGEPSRKYLWILSRTPALDQGLLQGLIKEISAMGYDPKMLIINDQNP